MLNTAHVCLKCYTALIFTTWFDPHSPWRQWGPGMPVLWAADWSSRHTHNELDRQAGPSSCGGLCVRQPTTPLPNGPDSLKGTKCKPLCALGGHQIETSPTKCPQPSQRRLVFPGSASPFSFWLLGYWVCCGHERQNCPFSRCLSPNLRVYWEKHPWKCFTFYKYKMAASSSRSFSLPQLRLAQSNPFQQGGPLAEHARGLVALAGRSQDMWGHRGSFPGEPRRGRSHGS